MRIVAVSALALVVLGTAGGVASAQGMWDGYLSGAFGSTEFAGDSPTNPAGDWIAQGRATFEAHSANNWGLQADGVYTHQNLSGIGGDPNSKFATTDAALHGFYRIPGHALFGVIGQWQQDEYRLYSSQWRMTQYWAGLEAQGFWNNLSVYGKAAWKSASIAGGSYTGHRVVRVGAGAVLLLAEFPGRGERRIRPDQPDRWRQHDCRRDLFRQWLRVSACLATSQRLHSLHA